MWEQEVKEDRVTLDVDRLESYFALSAAQSESSDAPDKPSRNFSSGIFLSRRRSSAVGTPTEVVALLDPKTCVASPTHPPISRDHM